MHPNGVTMTQPYITTYSDVIEAMQDFLQGHGSSAHQQVIRRAIQTAYREIVAARDWNCMLRSSRIQLKATQTTGTIAYDHTGGTYERQVTLTGDTWPEWAEDASIYLNEMVCDVESRKSDAVITLHATMNPGADLDAGTTYYLYPRWYRLPNNFASFYGPLEKTSWLMADEISLDEMARRQRYDFGTGDVRWYAVGSVPDLYGTMGLYIHYPSDEDEALDIVYKARPRSLRFTGHDAADYAGTVTATTGSATVTGSGTAVSAAHVGTIIRLTTSTTAKPTSHDGQNPFTEQRSIVAVNSAISFTLDAAVAASYTAVKYCMSDPIDIDISLYDAFLRCCEKHLAIARNFKHKAEVLAVAEKALFDAKCADGRSMQPRIAGAGLWRPNRLIDNFRIGEEAE